MVVNSAVGSFCTGRSLSDIWVTIRNGKNSSKTFTRESPLLFITGKLNNESLRSDVTPRVNEAKSRSNEGSFLRKKALGKFYQRARSECLMVSAALSRLKVEGYFPSRPLNVSRMTLQVM